MAANITVKVFGSCLKSIQACIWPQVVWQKGCLMPFLLCLSQLSPVFLAHAPAHTHAEHFSVMCLAECEISTLRLEGNRFDKIPFSAREASEAQNGMAKHGTARLVSPQTRQDLHGPAAPHRVNSVALPRPFSDCIMTLTSTDRVCFLFALAQDSINQHALAAKIQVPRMSHLYEACLDRLI